MNITTLNMTTLDGNVIIKKGGGGGATINNQDKVVDITENGTTEVVADGGYTGLGKVTINTDVPTVNNQDKTVDISENGTIEVVADSEFTGLGKVVIKVNIVDRTKAPDGVSIQHIDGKFYTTDDWVANGFSNDDANGVAVKGEQYGFVIAKTWFDGVPWSSDASNLVNGILTTTSSDEAKMDFAGAANTGLMLATDTSGAAYICSNYTFPNGAKGYLPAAGEADVITQNRTTINSAMTLINGNNVPNNPIWSSTQYSSTDAWIAWNRSISEMGKKQAYSCKTVVVTAI